MPSRRGCRRAVRRFPILFPLSFAQAPQSFAVRDPDGSLRIFQHFPCALAQGFRRLNPDEAAGTVHGCLLRNTPHLVGTHSWPCRSTNTSSGSQRSPSVLPTARTFPSAGSIRANPPGFRAAQMAPSEVSASQRTLSPPSPSFLVQVLACPARSKRVSPKLVPTQSIPSRARRILQIRSDGRPWSISRIPTRLARSTSPHRLR